VVFRHECPFDRSSLTRWRQRLGEDELAALLQESLAVAHRTRALRPKDLERVAVDTTVQEKAIAHPTDARPTQRAIEKLAKREGVKLRQSYLCVAKRAAIMVGPAIEPVIGHLKSDHMGRNYLKGREGDRANAMLAAGYNFSLLLRWVKRLLRVLFAALWRAVLIPRFA
jgi:hypothetical protein